MSEATDREHGAVPNAPGAETARPLHASEGAPAGLDEALPGSTRAARAAVRAASGIEPSLVDQVARVSTSPGCYLWRDAAGEVEDWAAETSFKLPEGSNAADLTVALFEQTGLVVASGLLGGESVVGVLVALWTIASGMLA